MAMLPIPAVTRRIVEGDRPCAVGNEGLLLIS
jgi:hypothetical protein